MKSRLFISVLSLITIVLFLNCHYSVNTSGESIDQERKVNTFTGINLGIAADVYLTQGKEQKVVLKGNDEVLKFIKTEVEGRILKIRKKEWHVNIHNKVEIYISIPEIDHLSVSGSGDIITNGPIKTNDLELKISGSGKIKMDDLSATNIESFISGSGNLFMKGNATIENYKIRISGSGDLNAIDMPVNNYNIKISGSGSCKINAIETLIASVSGSGKINYTGSPRIDANISGSGKVSPY